VRRGARQQPEAREQERRGAERFAAAFKAAGLPKGARVEIDLVARLPARLS